MGRWIGSNFTIRIPSVRMIRHPQSLFQGPRASSRLYTRVATLSCNPMDFTALPLGFLLSS